MNCMKLEGILVDISLFCRTGMVAKQPSVLLYGNINSQGMNILVPCVMTLATTLRQVLLKDLNSYM